MKILALILALFFLIGGSAMADGYTTYGNIMVGKSYKNDLSQPLWQILGLPAPTNTPVPGSPRLIGPPVVAPPPASGSPRLIGPPVVAPPPASGSPRLIGPPVVAPPGETTTMPVANPTLRAALARRAEGRRKALAILLAMSGHFAP